MTLLTLAGFEPMTYGFTIQGPKHDHEELAYKSQGELEYKWFTHGLILPITAIM